MSELLSVIDRTEPDDLIVGTQPPARIGSGVLKANAGALKRGTILAKGEDGKLDILGKDESAEAYGILADDTEASESDLPVDIYISGMFNANKLTVNAEYESKESDKDALRRYGIEFKAAIKY